MRRVVDTDEAVITAIDDEGEGMAVGSPDQGRDVTAGAGSDTTAIALRAIIYLLYHDPACMDRHVAEIDAKTNRKT